MRLTTKLKLGWKFRKHLWKHRALIRRRKQVAALAIGAAAFGTAALLARRAARHRAAAA